MILLLASLLPQNFGGHNEVVFHLVVVVVVGTMRKFSVGRLFLIRISSTQSFRSSLLMRFCESKFDANFVLTIGWQCGELTETQTPLPLRI